MYFAFFDTSDTWPGVPLVLEYEIELHCFILVYLVFIIEKYVDVN